MSENSLKKKTIRGTVWSFADNIANQGVTFLVGLILARILSPQEFGLIGIIMVFIALFNSIVDSGFSSALIRKSDASDKDYNTVFIVNLVLSCSLFVLLYVCAPAISHFFKQPDLVLLTRVMAIIVIINAFAIIQQTILIKNVDFKTQTKVSLIASVSSGVVGISMALTGFGVWSLVGQQVSRQLMNTVFLWIFNTWRPIWEFSVKSFKELFSFGWKLLVSGLIDTTWKEIYQVIIGKCYSTETLGQYTRAQQFNAIFSSNLTNVVQRVSYPVLSEIQDDALRLKLAYKKVIKTTMFVTFFSMLGLAAIAKPMVLVIIGEKWLPCVEFLQIICLSGMLYPLHAINLNMLKVQGRSDLFLRLEIIKKTIAVGPLLLGVFVNIYWMLWGSVVVGFFSYYLNAYYSGKLINYSIAEQVKDILPSFGIAAIMSLCVYAISYIPISPFFQLPLQIGVGALIILGLCNLMHLNEYHEIREMIVTGYKRIINGRKENN